MTYENLYNLREDIKEKSKSPAFYYFHKTKITEFYKKNAVELSIMDRHINKLHHTWCKKDEAGNFVYDGPEDNRTLQFETEEKEASYKAEIKEFFARTVKVII